MRRVNFEGCPKDNTRAVEQNFNELENNKQTRKSIYTFPSYDQNNLPDAYPPYQVAVVIPTSGSTNLMMSNGSNWFRIALSSVVG